MNWLTEDLPGIGGVYKQIPQDFQVEEIPLYPCSGEGEHLYLWIEKSGITTRNLLTQLARGLRLKERDLGYAGLKDARALTRQMISIPFNKLAQVKNLNLNQAEILDINRHTNKLRLGHLAGNHFTITLRETDTEPLPRSSAIFAQLQQRGVPNLFGEQRYGVLGNSAQLGLLLAQKNFVTFCREFIGDPQVIRNPGWKKAAEYYRQGEEQQAIDSLPKRMRDERQLLQMLIDGKSHHAAVFSLSRNLLRLFLSAAQSSFFDQLLMQRLPDLDQLRDGDIAIKHINRACFRVKDVEKEQPRVNRFEISPSAPLYGSKVMLATGKTGQSEMDFLEKSGLTLNSWKLPHGLTMTGERRPLRVPLTEPKIIVSGDHFITLSFTLPKGSYATSVLRELIKENQQIS
ncbi:MAG: tRNA pseudouridine(13) synthase TruD [Desulfuromusa sp.]|nr:tRNA pseudouridine(13) synthase TruD [Desulfuromusa sp.]